jgi:hypothetical protein
MPLRCATSLRWIVSPARSTLPDARALSITTETRAATKAAVTVKRRVAIAGMG